MSRRMRRSFWRALALIWSVAGVLFWVGSGRAQSAPDCRATLLSPADASSLSLPQTFHWQSGENCPALALAFATSSAPDSIVIFDELLPGQTEVSLLDWITVLASLDPDRQVSTYYWTVVELPEGTFIERAPWRSLFTVSRLQRLQLNRDSGVEAPTDRPLPLTVAVEYDAVEPGVLQVSIEDSERSVFQRRWSRIGAAGHGEQLFEFTLEELVEGNKDYQVTARFRPNAEVGPLAGEPAEDVVLHSPDFQIRWRAPVRSIAPTVIIDSPSTDRVTTRAGSIALSGRADGTSISTVRWTTSGGLSGLAVGTTAWSIAEIPLTPGANAIVVVAVDAQGLEGSDTMTVDFRPTDDGLPTVVITHPVVGAGAVIRQSTVEVRGTAQDDVGVAEVRWSNQRGGSGNAFGTTEWIVPSVPLEVGINVITITALDLAGNERRAELRLTVAVPDASPPYVAVLQPSAEFTYSSSSNSVQLRGVALDGAGIAEVTWTHARLPELRGVAKGTSEWAIDEVPLFVGGNLITVTARDLSNNKASRQIFVTFFPSDVVGPTLIVAQREPNQTLVTQIARLALSGSAVDNVAVARVNWSTDGGAKGVAAGTSAWSAADIPLRRGTNVVTISALDPTGNRTDVTVPVLYEPSDQAAPILVVDPPERGEIYATRAAAVTFTGTASDDLEVALVRWILEDGRSGQARGTTAWEATVPVNLGRNRVTLMAVDVAGKTDEKTVMVESIPDDNMPPVLTIAEPTDAPLFESLEEFIQVGGRASDNLRIASVTWANDRGETGTASGTDSWFVSDLRLRLGANVLTFAATDLAGLVTEKRLVVTYAPVDVTPPELRIVSPEVEDGVWSESATVNVSGTVTDNVAVARLFWVSDRGGRGNIRSEARWSTGAIPLLLGDNTITVIATDTSGNSRTASLTLNYVPAQKRPVPQDLNGDQQSDLVFQHTNGQGAVWFMHGTELETTAAPFALPRDWRIAGLGDFNEDARPDLVLQHTDGSIAFWLLEGTLVRTKSSPYRAEPGWTVRCVADLDGDQRSDLVLQHTDGSLAVWYMRGLTLVRSHVPHRLPGTWEVRASADFNLDGHADLVFQDAKGAIAFWLMEGTQILRALAPYQLPTGWQLVGTGQFSDDAHPDIVLHHEDGTVAFWLMTGTGIVEGRNPYVTPPGWRLRASQ